MISPQRKSSAFLLAAGLALTALFCPQPARAQYNGDAPAQISAPLQKPAPMPLKPGDALVPGQKAEVKPLVPPELPPEPEKPMVMEDMNTVVLRTIDKLSARTHTFDIPVNKTVKFGNALFIKVRACRKSSPLDKPESAAFLQIWEHPSGEAQAKWMFSGWMFASSPSLSALDHPVYDVWVIDCKNAKTSVKEDAAFSSEQAPGKVPPEGAKPAPKSDAKSDEVKSDTPAPSAAKPSPAPSGARPGLTPRDLEQLPGSFDDDSGTDDAAPSTDDPQD